VDSVARLVIGAQMVVYALPSAEDLALAVLGFRHPDYYGLDAALATDGGES
jgi:hypothetical protein